ncbi:hypothetical protein GACE_2050 [Geoglobus acetivorans]|uniref:Uncharacterized protein n=1 Tax=Geoglobus acetivorans TaxID=565033 RepID=A0A0A7GG98_GEOAI|nr:hypothetical protein GACE_2050 [Geoglobus acetivorans]
MSIAGIVQRGYLKSNRNEFKNHQVPLSVPAVQIKIFKNPGIRTARSDE